MKNFIFFFMPLFLSGKILFAQEEKKDSSIKNG